MKIAIDVSSVVYGTGVSVYVKELVGALARVDKKNSYLLWGGSWRQTEEIREWFNQAKMPSNFELKVLAWPPKLQAVVWNDWHVGNLEWLIGEFDVYHSVDWSLAPTRYRTVITVHDLFYIKRPDLQLHPHEVTMRRRLERAKDMRLCAIAVSQTTRQDLVELLDYPKELVSVIYEAAPSWVGGISKLDKNKMRKKYNIEGDYWLMVGTREPRKNLDRTLRAFRDFRESVGSEVSLVVAGKMGWGKGINKEEGVLFTGFVSDEELVGLFEEARGFLYPSLYEGFGQPILEAMGMGVPVLTSEVSSMPEVGGAAAIYVNPGSEESIKKGMRTLLNLAGDERKELIRKGKKQVNKFSWEKAAKETMKVYEQSFKNGGEE